jgi:hypothetical protein
MCVDCHAFELAVIAAVGYACLRQQYKHHASRVLLVLATHPWLALLAVTGLCA